MATKTIIYIIIAGIAALTLALFQYMYKSKKQNKLYKGLSILRFFTVFAILLLLINPKFESVSYEEEKPNLAILIDN